MKKLFYLILILIIIGLSYLKWSAATTGNTAVTPSPTPSPSSSSQAQNTKSLETAYFKLDYPLEATSSSVNEGPDSLGWRISYMGDTQKNSGRTQTELFDGYAVTLTRFETIGTQVDLEQANADRQGIIDACGEENVTKIESAKLGSYDALTFFGGCLGEANHYYLMIADSLYRLTEMVVGPESSLPQYHQSTKLIFDSLKFN